MSPHQGPVVIGHLVGEEVDWSLDEVCRLFSVERHWVVELIEHGVIETRPAAGQRFGGAALRRVRIAARLRRDRGIHPASTALPPERLDRLPTLETAMSRVPT